MNIKEMSIEQLKSTAYDQLVIIENAQKALNLLNQEIYTKEKEKDRKKDKSSG
jgi:hypothetical protein